MATAVDITLSMLPLPVHFFLATSGLVTLIWICPCLLVGNRIEQWIDMVDLDVFMYNNSKFQWQMDCLAIPILAYVSALWVMCSMKFQWSLCFPVATSACLDLVKEEKNHFFCNFLILRVVNATSKWGVNKLYFPFLSCRFEDAHGPGVNEHAGM